MGVARTLVAAVVAFAAGFAVRPVAKGGAPRVESATAEAAAEASVRLEPSASASPVRAVESRPAPRPVSRSVPARQLVASLARAAAGENDPEDTLQAMARLARLDASMAAEFVERWRAERDPRMREAAMTLVLLCGGPDAVAFVRERLADDRAAILTALAGASQGVPIPPRRLPVDDALAATAMDLRRSPDVTARLAAVTLLAAHDTESSRDALRRMGESDADAEVRAAAARTLRGL